MRLHSWPWWTAPLIYVVGYGVILALALKRPPFGRCDGCRRFACPLVGRGLSRRREHAYCGDCMPELYE
jgi:hypothetical protein